MFYTSGLIYIDLSSSQFLKHSTGKIPSYKTPELLQKSTGLYSSSWERPQKSGWLVIKAGLLQLNQNILIYKYSSECFISTITGETNLKTHPSSKLVNLKLRYYFLYSNNIFPYEYKGIDILHYQVFNIIRSVSIETKSVQVSLIRKWKPKPLFHLMIDFVVHSEKAESTLQGNKTDSDQRFLRSSINIRVKSGIKFKQRKQVISRNITRIKMPLHKSSKMSFTWVSSNPSEICRNPSHVSNQLISIKAMYQTGNRKEIGKEKTWQRLRSEITQKHRKL